MKLHHFLFVCCFSAMMDANIGITIYQKKEGTLFKIQWQFRDSSESPKFLCRNECKDGDVLLNTTENRAENGSSSFEYKITTSADGVLHVNIANLSKSDSGRYRCGLGRSSRDFEVRVVGAREEEINIHTRGVGEQASVACYFPSPNGTKFFCRGRCEDGTILLNTTEDQASVGRYNITYKPVSFRNSFILRVSVRELNRSDTGRYTCGLGETLASASFQKFNICVTDDASKSACTLRSHPASSTSTSHGLRSAAESPPSDPPGGFTALLLALIICVPVAVVLLVGVSLSLHRLKEAKKPQGMDVTLLAVTYENEIFSLSHPDGQSIDGEQASF